MLDALDVSGNPLANEGVSALLLAHHALPAERPCRLRMEEVCVRPGSNLPLLLAKLSAGEPIEMQARSSEIEIERSRLPASHTPPCGTLCAHAHCCPPAAPRRTPGSAPVHPLPPPWTQDLEEAGAPDAAARAMSKVAALDRKSKSAANKSKHGKPRKSTAAAAAAAAPSAAPAAAKPLPFDAPGAKEDTAKPKPYMDPANLKIR